MKKSNLCLQSKLKLIPSKIKNNRILKGLKQIKNLRRTHYFKVKIHFQKKFKMVDNYQGKIQ